MSFTPFSSNKTVAETYKAITDSLKANFNHNAGEQFPTGTLEVGTLCYRTDKNALYVLTDVENETWELVAPVPEIATTEQATEGTNDTIFMTPKKVKESVLFNAPVKSYATSVQAIDGINDETIMTPKKVKEVVDVLKSIVTANKATADGTIATNKTGVAQNKADIARSNIENAPIMSYPIGAVYLSVSSTSPATLFGGTWEELPEGRMLVAQGTNWKAGSKGGESTHTLTTDEMPSHSHDIYASSWQTGGGSGGMGYHTHQRKWGSTESTGGGKAHNNMPPYLVVYMWKRIA